MSDRGTLARAVGFGLVTVVFAPVPPLVLVGLPLALLLVATGTRNVWLGIVVAAVAGLALAGERNALWWFARGWPLLLGGMYVLAAAWRPGWNFTATALAALGTAAAAAAAMFMMSPGAWLDVDTVMAAQVGSEVEAWSARLNLAGDETAQGVLSQAVGVQVALFPALLGVSSLGALGLAVAVRDWMSGDAGRAFGRLRSFSFSDHLVWVWLLGLALIVAPIGSVADRIGGNAVLFMGLLYVLRGFAVLLSLVGGISVLMGVVGGLLAVLLYPLLAFFLAVALIVGLGDTWLNIRGRLRSREAAQ
ncbi:MAG: hypothetical protein JSV86_00310 [Gemmatimonadota bacterium]|nr:MAG: hypothetical protein JSV86_00310 [Gemmatimonadota bacterium]